MEATPIGEKGLVEGSESIAGGKQNEEVLKKIIATHPLYEVLVQSHIKCLKVRNFPFSFLPYTFLLLLFLFFTLNYILIKKIMLNYYVLREKDTSH